MFIDAIWRHKHKYQYHNTSSDCDVQTSSRLISKKGIESEQYQPSKEQ